MAAGLGLGYLLGLPLAPFLPLVSHRDPVLFVSAAGVLTLVAFVAIGVPAIRAARTQPMEALRVD